MQDHEWTAGRIHSGDMGHCHRVCWGGGKGILLGEQWSGWNMNGNFVV